MDALKYFSCCGNGYCKSCDEENDASISLTTKGDITRTRNISVCPLCRARFPHSEVVQAKQIEAIAKKGRAWAQHTVGLWYFQGRDGKSVDKKEAFKWFQLTADQHFPPAINSLAEIYRGGYGVVEKDRSKEIGLWLQSANLGNSNAQMNMAQSHYYIQGHLDLDKPKAIFYATLACVWPE